jgi:hypothetical protein
MALGSLVVSGADTMTGVMSPAIHSLQLRPMGNEFSAPIILLNSNDYLDVVFDELSDNHSYLRYSLVHCDANGSPSQLVESQYLTGFNQGDVDEPELSMGTTVNYANYRITLPNERINFKVSGDYLLKIYNENRPEEILAQGRFSVTEDCAKISGEVTSITDVEHNGSTQQVNFCVDVSGCDVSNPYADLKVVVTQNNAPGSGVVLSTPQRVSGKRVYYEHMRQLIFPAGNEFRRFETTSVTIPGLHVDGLEYINPYYHATITTDEVKRGYEYDETQHGHYKIRELNSSTSDTEADYVMTHFTLKAPYSPNRTIFLDGDFTYHKFLSDYIMMWDSEYGVYRSAVLLKQGAYNYRYISVEDGQVSMLDGNYYETSNEYLIRVYYRAPGARYDRLIGTKILHSK